MKLSHLFIFNSALSFIYGISFVLFPATVLSLHGVTLGANVALVGQLFGVALIAIGLMTWLTRNTADFETQRAITLSLFVADVLGVIVSMWGTMSGVMNAMGWLPVIFYFLLALGFGYFQFVKSETNRSMSLPQHK